ncbi:MAG: hypothetical protein COT92_02675 [Candidatus Doudnabacteria bacterium CG10_big_fil_rev_8_21_14_0_10_42_18]|uniref:Uncharacterized protein n=1 Tax=Candidatus Doudnabacteria bacterium CG10_big_fil_rev_8_21_14_0_10_42_18 TaxID=1974552 RepID=A0A2H0VAK1_9BACT|nr:MAG: hypothetical protein COT92_02675 [Candidatus Doudnabacteria bacterium CG10_big_fil_rev_8_21_14_0_10_42_18]
MRESQPNPENQERRNKIVALGKQAAECYLNSLAINDEDEFHSILNYPIPNPQKKIWLFVPDPQDIKIKPHITRVNIEQAEHELGPMSDEEKKLFLKAYKQRIYMGSPMNEA